MDTDLLLAAAAVTGTVVACMAAESINKRRREVGETAIPTLAS